MRHRRHHRREARIKRRSYKEKTNERVSKRRDESQERGYFKQEDEHREEWTYSARECDVRVLQVFRLRGR
jgi:hypothetical protein